GLSVILLTAVGVGWATKFIPGPIGTSLDILLFIMFFGLLLKQVKERDFAFARSPISFFVLMWVFYNLLEVLNPWADSRLAWFFTVRSMAGLILLYFVACYAFSNLRAIVWLLKLILAAALVSALYGLKQEFFGFSASEMAWLYSDPERFQLIFQWSRLRIFSFFSDPTNFGIFMSYSATLCLVLASGPFKIWQRLVLLGSAFCMILAMAYAGSRTPFILLPVGLIFFALLTLKRNVLIAMGFFFVLGSALMLKSTSSAVIYRIQSAFDLSKSDDTVKVRLDNQKYIQPFIHRHPFGAGLGATGIWGKRFSPQNKLANFAHDSGFVRIAVELGWIGLILYCAFLFVVLRTTIYYFLRVRDPKIKTVYLGLATIFFQLTLANYPQEALVVLPTSIIFYITLAMSARLKDFDGQWTSTEVKAGRNIPGIPFFSGRDNILDDPTFRHKS
ncbi:MAG: O-antigen ligase family protein, partial [Bacteroidota bacterium]